MPDLDCFFAISNRNSNIIHFLEILEQAPNSGLYCILFSLNSKMFRHITQANFTIFVFSLSDTSFIIFIRQIYKI